ncbi:MAG: hypothetical protein ACREH4_15890 [Vitreimonas sp.]
MVLRAAFLLLVVGACASQAREPLSVDALVADAPGYVAVRYQTRDLPAALIADLTSQEFQCQHSAAMSECGRARHAFASCWDVVTVRVASETVRAEQNRRCMGAQQP